MLTLFWNVSTIASTFLILVVACTYVPVDDFHSFQVLNSQWYWLVGSDGFFSGLTPNFQLGLSSNSRLTFRVRANSILGHLDLFHIFFLTGIVVLTAFPFEWDHPELFPAFGRLFSKILQIFRNLKFHLTFWVRANLPPQPHGFCTQILFGFPFSGCS